MLKWLDDGYVGESITDPQGIRRKVEKGNILPGIFLITLSEHPDHILEFFPCNMILNKRLRNRCPMIIGMARGKREAMELTCRIISNIYYETKGFQVAEYLKNR